MKPLKVEAVKLFTEVPNRGCLMNGQKDFKKKSLESKLLIFCHVHAEIMFLKP